MARVHGRRPAGISTSARLTNDVFEATGKHSVTIWMRGDLAGGDAHVADPDEIAEVGWFGHDGLPTPLFLSLENLLAGRSLPTMERDAAWRRWEDA